MVPALLLGSPKVMVGPPEFVNLETSTSPVIEVLQVGQFETVKAMSHRHSVELISQHSRFPLYTVIHPFALNTAFS